jgi:hypothetical protein
MKNMKRKLATAAGAVVAIAGGGAALAATQGSSGEESKAIVEDAAKQLGIDSIKLSDALKQALENRIDAAVADGRITKAQADELKQRVEADDFPLLGLRGGHGGPHGGGFGHHLDAAATYLGITEDALRTALEGGKSLADVAKDEGKAVDGLVQALVADERAELDQAVQDGRLTDAQRDSIVSGLQARITERVNAAGGFGGRGGRHGFGFGGPPPAGVPGAAFGGPDTPASAA